MATSATQLPECEVNSQVCWQNSATHTCFGYITFTLTHLMTTSYHYLLTCFLLWLKVLKILESDQTGDLQRTFSRGGVEENLVTNSMFSFHIASFSHQCQVSFLQELKPMIKGAFRNLKEKYCIQVTDQRVVPLHWLCYMAPSSLCILSSVLFNLGKRNLECEGWESKRSGRKPKMKF